VQVVDAVVAGNDYLADCALRAGARVERVQVIPTCVEPRDYPAMPTIVPADHVDLVWIGSSSTLRGLELSSHIWQRLAEAIPRLRVRIICDRFPDRFPLPTIPITWDAFSEARELAKGEIGISWLPDDAWSRGKCGLKVLQYQAAGLPVVANPVGVHPELIRPGETGFLASTPDEWVEAIRRLAHDPDLRSKMGHAARRQVEANYSPSAWSDTFLTAVTGGSPRVPVRNVKHPGPSSGRPTIEAQHQRASRIPALNRTGD
jgi:glycosyltransferase involved in cell wall biosynthesis